MNVSAYTKCAEIYYLNLYLNHWPLVIFLSIGLGSLPDFHVYVLYFQHRCFHHLVYNVISGEINNMTATVQEVISLIGALAVKLPSPQQESQRQNRKKKAQLQLSWTANQVSLDPSFSVRAEKAVIAALRNPTSDPWECFQECNWTMNGLLV